MRLLFTASLILGLSISLLPVEAKAPMPVEKVASIEMITAELEAQLAKLDGLLADPGGFDDNEEKIVQAGGVIACVSQALVEHPDRKKSVCAAAALRDAGIGLQEAGDYADAQKALATAHDAWKGKASGEHEEDHPWDELVDMYSMMEEMNDRNGGLSRSLRRPRGKLKEQLNASTNAILGLAMLADHNYVEDETQEKEWDQLSEDYLKAMIHLTKAIADKDKKSVAEYYKAGNRACDKCHEAYRD